MILDELFELVKEEGVMDPTFGYYQLKTWIKEEIAFIEKHEDFYIVYAPTKEINGERTLIELFFYIPKEKRGNIRAVLNGIKRFEEAAKEKDCDVLKVGANYGLKNDKFVKLLLRQGYKTDTLRKEIK